jgi:tetratricopeptide (TPR) repeat protein
MTTTRAPEGEADVRIARVHLRLGQLTLARAELEDLNRRELLDAASLAALAEARWRTGEVALAADAAQAHIDAGGTDDVALCIAAEAAAVDGRPDDARALMERLPASDPVALDALFAGMPRRAFWPAGPVDRSPVVDETPTQAYRNLAAERRTKGQLDPTAELSRARAELDSRPDRAFLRLALVLRHDPTLAPLVLAALHLRREPAAALLRGDAQRLLGRHLEAEAAFDAAAESLEAP